MVSPTAVLHQKKAIKLHANAHQFIVAKRTKISVADPDPGSGAFLNPGSGMCKKSESGSGMNNPDHIS
jgi:hypothetical protein